MVSCGKEFLDVKMNAATVIPATVEDYQRILDNGLGLMNGHQSYRLAFAASDEHVMEDEHWDSFYYGTDLIERNAYIWSKEVYENNTVDDWNNAYVRILHANMVLDGLGRMDREESSTIAWKEAKGAALFFRAYNYYQLAQLFCQPFNKESSVTDLGLPLRLESDLEMSVRRSSLWETYQRIMEDLKAAADLLPDQGKVKMRPSKAACYGILARLYLQMEEYDEAGHYASEGLKIRSELMDYKDLVIDQNNPFQRDYGQSNPEVVFGSFAKYFAVLNVNRMGVDNGLLNLYEEGDLRKSVFYTKHTSGRYIFKGSFWGSNTPFVGVSTSELYLIRAECLVRKGDWAQGLEIVNNIRRKRFKDEFFKERRANTQNEALRLVLEERRRELAFRGVRWEDLRRLNKNSSTATILTRNLKGHSYILEPTSNRYTWPLPDDVIKLGNYQQNLRE